MSLSLAESAKLSTTELQRGVIEAFVYESPLLEILPMMEIVGNSYAYNTEATLPGVAWRGVNDSYTESTGTVNQTTETLKIIGGDVDVDKFIVQTRSNVNDVRAEHVAMKIKSLVRGFQDSFINGDSSVDANEIDGLKKRLTGAQVITAATNGLPIIGSSEEDRQAFCDKLTELIFAVDGGADMLLMNKTIRTKIINAARRLGFIDKTVDGFGRPVMTFNGVPMIDIGTDVSGTAIIPLTEEEGTAEDCSSIYAVKFGPDAVSGLMNGSVMVTDLGEVQDKPAYRTRIEAYIGLAVFNGKSAARLKGVRNA